MFNFIKAFLGLKKALRNNTNKEKVIFYSESKNYRNYFLTFFKELLNSDKFFIQYITSDINDLDEFEKIKPIFIGNGIFLIIFFTIIKCKYFFMTLSNLGNHHLKKSKKCRYYIYIFHSMVSTHKCYEETAFSNYDIVFTLGDYQKKELKKLEELHNFPEKKIFNVGYFYTENMNKIVNKNLKEKNNILFAPSWNRNNKNLFEDYSIFIINKLIAHNFFVSLRTHPETLKRSNKIITKIKKNFINNKRFALNTDLNNFINIEKSEVLITDDGGVGIEYAYIFKRPVIFIDYIKKIHNKNYEELNIEPIEEKFKKSCGYKIKIDEISNLKNIIQDLNKDDEKIKNNYKAFFNTYELNIKNDMMASKLATDIIINKF